LLSFRSIHNQFIRTWLFIQSALKATTTKGKKDKKKSKKGVVDDDQVTQNTEADGDAAAPKQPVEVTADDLADEEWGPVKDKGRKAKSGKENKIKAQDESDNEEKPSTYTFHRSLRISKMPLVSRRTCCTGSTLASTESARRRR
jgi:hypothetical protein